MKKLFGSLILGIYTFVNLTLVHAVCMGFLDVSANVSNMSNMQASQHSCHGIQVGEKGVKTKTDNNKNSVDCRGITALQNPSVSNISYVTFFDYVVIPHFDVATNNILESIIGAEYINKSPPNLRKNFKSTVFADLVGIVKISVFIG